MAILIQLTLRLRSSRISLSSTYRYQYCGSPLKKTVWCFHIIRLDCHLVPTAILYHNALQEISSPTMTLLVLFCKGNFMVQYIVFGQISKYLMPIPKPSLKTSYTIGNLRHHIGLILFRKYSQIQVSTKNGIECMPLHSIHYSHRQHSPKIGHLKQAPAVSQICSLTVFYPRLHNA